MKRARLGWVAMSAAVAGIVGSAMILAGCEEAKGTRALTVSPSFVDLAGAGSTNAATQTFTVADGLRDLSLPLTWSVSDPSLGYIGRQGGISASYVKTKAHGDNSIIVRDQYDAEGVATVRQ